MRSPTVPSGRPGYPALKLKSSSGIVRGYIVQKPLVFTQGRRITRPDIAAGSSACATRIAAGVPLNSPACMPAVTSSVLPGCAPLIRIAGIS